jgi:sugar lactone lactonase YvrE
MRTFCAVSAFPSLRAIAFGVLASLTLLTPWCSSAQLSATFYGTTPVGQTSTPVSVTVSLTGIGNVATVQAVTQSQTGGEFAILSGGTCASGMNSVAGLTCTAKMTFTPAAPGLRQGAVMLLDASGNLLGETTVTGVGLGALAVLDPGNIYTVAGDGDWIYRGDGVLAVLSPIFLPMGVVADTVGNVYLSDSNNNRIRRVDAVTGTMSTVAGNGTLGFNGDRGLATAAMVSTPAGITMDGAGNIYFADTGNHVVRRIDAITRVITTVAGQGGVEGYEGDGGQASNANLSFPEAVIFDAAGNLYISDTGNNVVRKVQGNGIITTIAGTGAAGYSQDNVAATSSELNQPWGIAFDLSGALYIADLSNNRVRKVANGIITTIAGTGFPGFGGDNAPATAAWIKAPAAVAVDPSGNVYIADSGNNRVRKLYATTGNINTISGADSEQFGGDKGPANQATMYGPYALYLDGAGDLYVADLFHNRIREISANFDTLLFPTMRVSKTSLPDPTLLANDGNASLTLTQIPLVNAALDLASTTCSVNEVLAAGQDCSLGVEFAPAAVGDPTVGSITLDNSSQATSSSLAPVITLSGEVLSVNPTTVALSTSADPIALTSTVNFKATVSGANSLTGMMTFLDGSTPLCSITISGLSATCSVSTFTLGNHDITASYSGDDQDAASTSPVLVETVKQQPNYLLDATPNPAIVGQTVTLSFIAPVSTPGALPVGGTAVFNDGPTVIGSAPINNGTASITTTSLTVGTHALVVTASGDANNLYGTTNVLDVVIQPALTSTILSTNNANAPVGTPVTFTAAVSNGSSAAGAAVTGSVQFMDGVTSLGSASVNSSGIASATINSLPPGTHSIVAIYSGDAGNQGSQSLPLPEIIQQISTTTTLSSNSNPVNAGATLALTAHVIAAPGTSGGAITGNVSFTDGPNALGVVPVDANGNATLNINTLAVATHPIIATYAGNTNYNGSSSSTLQVTVQVSGTTTALSAASTTLLSGQPANLSISVSSPTGVPTGNVSIFDGSAKIGTFALSGTGVASFSATALTGGSHILTAVYAGDGNYTTSTSPGLQITVSLATTGLTLTVPAAPVVAGTSITVGTTLVTNGVAPTGTITLIDGSRIVGTLPVSAAGTMNFAGVSLSVGAHALTATYSGDTNSSPATSQVSLVTVELGADTETLTSSADPQILGQSVTFTATIQSNSPNASGNVTFTDGATVLASVPLNAAGVAAYTTTTLAPGSHTIGAQYGGDANHAASNTATLTELIVQESKASIGSSMNPSIAGNSLIFTAKITGGGQSIPSGQVIFKDGAALLGSVTLDPTGAASLPSSVLAVGPHTITVSYAGDNNYGASAASLIQTIQNASVQMQLTASANPTTYGKPLTLVATLTSNGSAATGSVSFTLDGAPMGTAPLSASGVAQLTTSTLSAGTHTIVASYAGDTRTSATTSGPLVVHVAAATAVALSSSLNPGQTLVPIVLTAVVSNGDAGLPTGTVTFADGSTQLGSATLDTRGVASLTLKSMASGSHVITASYSGDDNNFAGVSANLTETILLQPTTTTLSSAGNDSANAQSVLLIGVVHDAGSVAATGTITFTSGSQTLGSAIIDATGVATLSVTLQTGVNNIVATYSGDGNFAGSASQVAAITPTAAQQFALQLAPATLTMVTKEHGATVLTITSVSGYSDMLQFGCLGLPSAATCTFSTPSQQLKANGSIQVQLTVDTGDPLGGGAQVAANSNTSSGVLLCLLPTGLLLGVGLRRRRGAWPLLLVLFAVIVTASLTGCSGIQMGSTPAGTYNFKVTASGKQTGTTESQVLTLTVTQ